MRCLGPSLLGTGLALCLSGCLYTTQHFNTGRLLEPGETAVTLGMGRAHFYRADCPEGYYPSRSEGRRDEVCRSEAFAWGGPFGGSGAASDTVRPLERVRETTPKLSLGYRLGVRKRWGPLTGIEIGWALEGPTNPATLEFDVKAGLPVPAGWKAFHSLSAGWGVGAWVDNTWFAEYAAARPFFGECALFAGYRFSALATQPDDFDSSSSAGRFVRIPHYAHQIALGWYQHVPFIPVLPDHVVPALTLTLPVFRGADLRSVRPPAYDLNFNVGIGWDF
jgi:hypothetical protein